MSVNYIDKSTGDLIRVAGQGKAEYGASTVRKGTVGVPAIAANADYVDQTITFSTPMPDTDYLVDLSLQGSNTHRVAFHVVANTKTVNGFTVRFTPIGVKQTTEVGVSGVANNPSNYTLTVQRDEVRPNFTQYTAIVDPESSLPTEWNPMQTGYLRNPMPANESTLVYTAFKLYTDTEYNNLLNNAVLTSDVTDAVTNGDMNPVTSNAVYDAIAELFANDVQATDYTPTLTTGYAHPGDCWYMRKGNVVTVSIGIANFVSSSSKEIVFTLPAKVRPTKGRVFVQANGNDVPSVAMGEIDTSGNIKLTNSGSVNPGFFATWTYCVD